MWSAAEGSCTFNAHRSFSLSQHSSSGSTWDKGKSAASHSAPAGTWYRETLFSVVNVIPHSQKRYWHLRLACKALTSIWTWSQHTVYPGCLGKAGLLGHNCTPKIDLSTVHQFWCQMSTDSPLIITLCISVSLQRKFNLLMMTKHAWSVELLIMSSWNQSDAFSMCQIGLVSGGRMSGYHAKVPISHWQHPIQGL